MQKLNVGIKVINLCKYYRESILVFTAIIFGVLFTNIPFTSEFFHIINSSDLILVVGNTIKSLSLKHTFNDLVVGILFFLVGLEIKKSYLMREFSDFRITITAFWTSLGGVVVPFLMYYYIAGVSDHSNIWIAGLETDTAIVIYVLSPFRRKLPNALFPFLCLIAISDDIVGMLLFNSFYYSNIKPIFILASLAIISFLYFLRNKKVNNYILFYISAFAACLFCNLGGLHCTIAALLIAFLTPDIAKSNIIKAEQSINNTELSGNDYNEYAAFSNKLSNINRVNNFSYLSSLNSIQYLVAFFLLPIYVFFNSDVKLSREVMSSVLGHSATLGLFLQLFIGKSIGISSFLYFAVKSKIGKIPEDIDISIIFVVSILFGIGYTFSFFIVESLVDSAIRLAEAKTAIFLASLASMVIGLIMLKFYQLNRTAH